MTNAQKWVAVFLILFIGLFALQQITKKEKEVLEDFEFYGDKGESIQLDGPTLVVNLGCVKCHGTDLKGSVSGPGLYDAKQYWNRKDLINYLRSPSSYDGDERFDQYRIKYKSIVMPSFNSVEVKDLGVLADYLLNLK